MSGASPPTSGIQVEPFDGRPSMEQMLATFQGTTQLALLDTSRVDGGFARFSIVAGDPAETVEITQPHLGNPWQCLRDRLGVGPHSASASQLPIPFAGGWIGWVGYEFGASAAAGSVRRGTPRPSLGARFSLYDTVAVFDHAHDRWYLAAVDWVGGRHADRPPVRRRLDRLRASLRAACDERPTAPPDPTTTEPVSNMTLAEYLGKVQRIKRYIDAGDVYQVNFAQRFTARTTASPLEVYRRLRCVSPSTQAALIGGSNGTIVSSSPELFFDLRGRHVLTRPIKGTRPRSDDPVVDAAWRCELAQSEKDRAELAMIVDVVRNDLGRVGRFGTVQVVEPATIEDHPTVFHQVATLEGELRSECSWSDLLEATFPGASVTGAPKIRAMQIIDELEPSRRGVYCGSIGWVGLNGDASFNIAIRTLVQRGQRVDFHVGGGIVADSDPHAEYQETLAKAAGILKALNVPSSVDARTEVTAP